MYFDFGLEKNKNNNENQHKLSLPYMTSNSNSSSITDLYTYLVVAKENREFIYGSFNDTPSEQITLCLKVG